VFLSDRIFVMSPQPGRLRAELAVPLPAPRTAETRLFARLPGPRGRGHAPPARRGDNRHLPRVNRRRPPAMPRKFFHRPAPVLTGALFLGAWQAVCLLLDDDHRFLLPAPLAVLAALRAEWPALSHAACNTAKGALPRFRAGRRGELPAPSRSRSPPRAWVRAGPLALPDDLADDARSSSFAPMLVIWAGPGLPSVIVITFLICFFPLW